MGYNTDFFGEGFNITPPLTPKLISDLDGLNETRYQGLTRVYPKFPGNWCQWVSNENGTRLEWDGGEKFYDYREWLKFIVENIIKPSKRELNGSMEWQGEDPDDFGKLIVKNNVVTAIGGIKVYPGENS